MTAPSPRDWTSDFPHENGNYSCKCITCGEYFHGHKRRVECKVCDDKARVRWDALTPEQRDAETRAFIDAMTRKP